MKKGTAFQSTEFSDTDEQVLPEGFRYEIICNSGDPLTANQVHSDYMAYVPVDTLEGSEVSEDGTHWVNQEHIDTTSWSDSTDPESQTKKTKEYTAREKAERLAKVKSILAASTRRDWEADGSRLWVCKGDTELKIVDLTEDAGRVELDEEWARSAGTGSVALRVELSICEARSCWRRSLQFAWTQAGRSYLCPAKRRATGPSSIAGTTTFAGSSHRGSIWARTRSLLPAEGGYRRDLVPGPRSYRRFRPARECLASLIRASTSRANQVSGSASWIFWRPSSGRRERSGWGARRARTLERVRSIPRRRLVRPSARERGTRRIEGHGGEVG